MTALQLRYAIAYFLVPLGFMTTWSLWWWHRRGAHKAVPNGVILMQALAWTLILYRGAFYVSLHHIDGLPSWEMLFSISLMTLAQVIHLLTIINSTKTKGR